MDQARNIETVGPATLFSEHQKEALVVLPWLAGLISTLSSLAIIYTLFVDKEEKKVSPFRRLLFGASLVDIITSGTMVVMGGWAVPPDAWTNSLWANGNILSCNIMGFLLIFGQGAQMMYSASLALYHLVVVRYRWSNKTIATYLEPVLHVVSFIVPMLYNVLTLRGDYINSSHLDPGTCGPHTHPPNCLHYPEIECTRGHHVSAAHTISLIAFLAAVVLVWIVILVSNVLVWQTVRATESRMQRYGRASSRASSLVMTKKVGVQGILFVGSFVLSNILIIIRLLVLYPLFETSHANRTLYFWVQAFCLPLIQLQGLFHAIIYFRPRWSCLVRPGRAWDRLSFQPRTAEVSSFNWDVSSKEEKIEPTAKHVLNDQESGMEEGPQSRGSWQRLSLQKKMGSSSLSLMKEFDEGMDPTTSSSDDQDYSVIEADVMDVDKMGENAKTGKVVEREDSHAPV